MTPRVVVNYGLGAASPAVIAAAAAGTCDLTWHCDLADPHCKAMLPVLRRLGHVTVSGPGALLDDVTRGLGTLRPRGITTFCDARVLQTAQLASRLGLPGNPPPAATLITDKYAQRQALRSSGLQDLQYRLVTTYAALERAVRGLNGPVIVKPVHGQGSRHTFRIAAEGDFIAVRAAVLPAELAEGYIVEEELAGRPAELGDGIADYVSVETVTAGGEHHVVGIVGRLTLAYPFRERGGFYPSTLEGELANAVSRLAASALTALGVSSGVSHTEIKLTPRGPEILEVNGRLGGHVAWLIRRNRGPDLVRAALLTALGESPVLETDPAGGVAFRHVPPAPQRIGVADRVDGVRQVRDMPGVEAVEMRVRRGTPVDWREGTGSCLAEISGWAGTHREMVRCTSRIEDLLRVTLAGQPGPGTGCEVNGHEQCAK
jgi:biotin carboxylase